MFLYLFLSFPLDLLISLFTYFFLSLFLFLCSLFLSFFLLFFYMVCNRKTNNPVKFGVPGFFDCSGVPGCSGVFRCSGVPGFSTCYSRHVHCLLSQANVEFPNSGHMYALRTYFLIFVCCIFSNF